MGRKRSPQSFEKRRRELKKKQQRQEKLQRKQDGEEPLEGEVRPEEDEGYFPVDDAVPEFDTGEEEEGEDEDK